VDLFAHNAKYEVQKYPPNFPFRLWENFSANKLDFFLRILLFVKERNKFYS